MVPKTVATLQNRDIFTHWIFIIQFADARFGGETVRKAGELTANLTKVPVSSFPSIERNDYCSEFHAADTMLPAS